MCFVYRAEGAYPICGEVFELGAGGNTIVGVANCGVIDVAADVTYVLFHVVLVIKR